MHLLHDIPSSSMGFRICFLAKQDPEKLVIGDPVSKTTGLLCFKIVYLHVPGLAAIQ